MTDTIGSGLAIILMATALAFNACALVDGLVDGSVECMIAPPETHPGLVALSANTGMAWTARWYDERGTLREKRGLNKPSIIRLPGTGVTPVLLFEETALPGFTQALVPCAGALFPLQATEGTRYRELRPTRRHGQAARSAERVILGARGGTRAGMSVVAAFDWLRLISLIESLQRPESADIREIASKMLDGSFSSRYVRELSATSSSCVVAPWIDPGDTLYPANPEFEPVVSREDGSAEVMLREGLNRFYASEGYLDLQFGAGEIVCTFFRSYASMEQ